MNAIIEIKRTPVERWLSDLGLHAVEVDRCPSSDCVLCADRVVASAA